MAKNEGAVPHKTDFVPQEELKSNHSVGEREVTKQRNLDRVRIRDPANRKRIVSTHHLIPTFGLVSSPDLTLSRGETCLINQVEFLGLSRIFCSQPTLIREVLCKNY